MAAPRSPEAWARAIDELAARAAPGRQPSPFAVDACLAADLARDAARPSAAEPPATAGRAEIDLRLWWQVAADDDARVDVVTPILVATGPLAPHLRARGIEVWTETELCALHALDTLARRSANPALATRRDTAASWLLAEMQPDNATNLPWGVQVFVQRWCDGGDAGALLYAQSQLHACRVSLGVPDARSGLILKHAARLLSAPPGQQ